MHSSYTGYVRRLQQHCGIPIVAIEVSRNCRVAFDGIDSRLTTGAFNTSIAAIGEPETTSLDKTLCALRSLDMADLHISCRSNTWTKQTLVRRLTPFFRPPLTKLTFDQTTPTSRASPKISTSTAMNSSTSKQSTPSEQSSDSCPSHSSFLKSV